MHDLPNTHHSFKFNVNADYIINLSRQILYEMWQRKMRSFLAIFCIAWGVLVILLLLALGRGFHEFNQKAVVDVVDGAYVFFPSRTSKSYRGLPLGREVNIKAKDVIDLIKYIPNLSAATPMLATYAYVGVKGKRLWKRVHGVGSSLIQIRKLQLSAGRFLNKLDENQSARVVVIGHRLEDAYFAQQNVGDVIGKKIFINKIPFTVVGTLQDSRYSSHTWYNNNALIPYTTYIALWGDQNVRIFAASVDFAANFEQVKESLMDFLAYKHHFAREDKLAVKAFGTSDMLRFMNGFFIGIKIFLGICGALTLGVGSLGVTNIMFLIVTERMREIGLRKALGAYDWHILLQILLETLIITMLGGVLGFFVAYTVVGILQHAPTPEWFGQPMISLSIALVVVGVLSAFGVMAGYFPARRASLMDPVDALRLK